MSQKFSVRNVIQKKYIFKLKALTQLYVTEYGMYFLLITIIFLSL
ncbi:hypothetical protein SPACI_016020 [Sporomusa acidovorans DSM 3132]|uniref:Uncharacterized protein n=1 Tax=Sporomusa acidovorans (strain ATCC 49682 / DSM 3132 / Mol) TaxID=1123286 RepID=A0ABZ3J068_SPOA4|nr:hypothetical protein SPACI_01060 [Sporomusa acidovorans DSM 3132]SDF55595.1 hypothetical protein SAMN04488499_10584 [Sporomusa acidovorans]